MNQQKHLHFPGKLRMSLFPINFLFLVAYFHSLLLQRHPHPLSLCHPVSLLLCYFLLRLLASPLSQLPLPDYSPPVILALPHIPDLSIPPHPPDWPSLSDTPPLMEWPHRFLHPFHSYEPWNPLYTLPAHHIHPHNVPHHNR